ncbi:MAG: transposase [bacterium]|nr:transposase [bacterium]
MYKNRPPHLYLDKTFYFLTARTYQKQEIFDSDDKKMLMQNSLKAEFQSGGHLLKAEFQSGGYKLMSWVVLSNHYHILLQVKNSKTISKRINYLHGRTSYLLNKKDNRKGRKVFQNYWDYCIRNEADYWKHFNYIHYNPVKHGLTKEPGSYRYSSYNFWIKNKGREWMVSCFESYPIIDFTP